MNAQIPTTGVLVVRFREAAASELRQIPTTGLTLARFQEAATSEMRQIMELVRAALQKKMYPDGRESWVHIEAVFPDRVVCQKDGRYWSYPYSLAEDNTVGIGDPVEVIEQYVPVAMREADATFLEAEGPEKKNVLVRVVRAGLSHNKVYYPDAVLREAAPLFENCRVFVKGDEEHLKGAGKDFNKLVGRLVNARFVAGAMPDSGEVRATFQPIEPDGAVAVKIREAVNNRMADLFGLSIDADGTAKVELREGQRIQVAKSITKVHSTDVIVSPGAGGEFIRLVEAIQLQEETDMALRARMIEAIKAKHGGTLPAGLNVEDDAALEVAYREAIVPQPPSALATARAAIQSSTLPQPAKDKLLADFGARTRFVEADVTAAIEGERAYLARFVEAGHVQGLGDGRIEGGQDRSEKVKQMLDDFFGGKDLMSFREAYIEITGDRRVTGRTEHCDAVRLREAAGAVRTEFREAVSAGTFAAILGDSITRRMIADYRDMGQYDVWRPLTGTPVPVGDFRVNKRTRIGGYGDIPKVAERGSYNPLATPGEDEIEYRIEKRGGTEDISLESIRNDDVGLIRRIPTALSRAAKRTLAKFVLDFLKDNPTIYDDVALFHASHGNLSTVALSATSLGAARLAMLQQTEKSSNERVGIGPRYLYVPSDLEQTAGDLFIRNTNNDANFIQRLSLNVVPVWYWTDATDWVIQADPVDIASFELAFLDGNQEPELFVQDSPTFGSLFSNDVLTWKLRHIYGGNILDYRGLHKAVVA